MSCACSGKTRQLSLCLPSRSCIINCIALKGWQCKPEHKPYLFQKLHQLAHAEPQQYSKLPSAHVSAHNMGIDIGIQSKAQGQGSPRGFFGISNNFCGFAQWLRCKGLSVPRGRAEPKVTRLTCTSDPCCCILVITLFSLRSRCTKLQLCSFISPSNS